MFGRISDGICLPTVWPSVSSPSIYKINETCDCPSAKIGITSHNLSRRHFVYESNTFGTPSGHVNCITFARQLRFCCESKQVSVQSIPNTGVPGFPGQHRDNDLSSTANQSRFNQESLRSSKSVETSDCPSDGPLDRETDSFHAGNFPCSTALSAPTASQKRSPSGGTYDSQIVLNQECYEELQWWLTQLDALNGRAILTPPPNLVIETDASTQGWGTVCNGIRIGGLWSQAERLHHINCLELLAGAFAQKSFTKIQILLHVRLRMDNTTAIAYINKLGGTRSLVLSKQVHDFKCQTSTRHLEHAGRSGMKVLPRFKRLENRTNHLGYYYWDIVFTIYGYVKIQLYLRVYEE